MTQDGKVASRGRQDLDIGTFGLGLGDLEPGPEPDDVFGGGQERHAPPARAHELARAPTPAVAHRPDPDDLPDMSDRGFGLGFGSTGDFDPDPMPAAPPQPARRSSEQGDWSSLAGIAGPASRAPAFGVGADEGDPEAEFADQPFGGARSVASIGRVPDLPDPTGSYRADKGGPDDVVGSFVDTDDDQNDRVDVDGRDPPSTSLYRDDALDDDPAGEDRSLVMEGDEEANAATDEEAADGPSILDRIKRFAIPAAAAAAVGGVGLLGWPYVAPMMGMGADEYVVQAPAQIVPKQAAAGLPAFPPSVQQQQPRPALPGASAGLPALPGQTAVAVQPGANALPGALPAAPPRQIQLPPVGDAAASPLSSAPQQMASQPAIPPIAGQGQGSPVQRASFPDLPPVEQARGVPYGARSAPTDPLAGGLNVKRPSTGDLETRLASIASALPATRSRQDEVARSAQTDREEFGRRLGVLEQRVSDGRTAMTPKPAAELPRSGRSERADRTERVEKPARAPRRAEPRPSYQQEASPDDGLPPLKPKVVQGYSLKGVSRNIASVEGRNGVVEVGVGQTIPGVGEVKAIRRYGSDWVVVVGKGVIVQQ